MVELKDGVWQRTTDLRNCLIDRQDWNLTLHVPIYPLILKHKDFEVLKFLDLLAKYIDLPVGIFFFDAPVMLFGFLFKRDSVVGEVKLLDARLCLWV